MARAQRLLDLLQLLRRHLPRFKQRFYATHPLAIALGIFEQPRRERGLSIAQAPVAMDFGMTFVALDPDGHRLRVFAPAHSGTP